jgi:redox-sensing transcriptional repressor
MTSRIPNPSINRLCKIYTLLEELEAQGAVSVSSNEIGEKIGVGPHSVRKDISFLGEVGTVGSGYEIIKLKKYIGERLGLQVERKACVVGLGKLGTAILQNEKLFSNNFKIVAGFDSNVNKLETIVTHIPLHPTYELSDIIKKQSIELAVITVPGHASSDIIDRLVEGGIRGIVNFSSAPLHAACKEKVYVSNFDIAGEFRFLSALFTMERH